MFTNYFTCTYVYELFCSCSVASSQHTSFLWAPLYPRVGHVLHPCLSPLCPFHTPHSPHSSTSLTDCESCDTCSRRNLWSVSSSNHNNWSYFTVPPRDSPAPSCRYTYATSTLHMFFVTTVFTIAERAGSSPEFTVGMGLQDVWTKYRKEAGWVNRVIVIKYIIHN